MARFLRVALLVAVASTIGVAGAFANIPDPALSDVPGVITITPDGSFAYTVTIRGALGPVNGALVTIEFDLATQVKIGYCLGQAGFGGGFTATGVTNAAGEASFFIEGGGCIQVPNGPFVAQVKADAITMAEPTINSPDIVDASGGRADDTGVNVCGAGGGASPDQLTVGLSDAVEHTGNIALGLTDVCSNFTGPDYGDPVGLADAVIITGYVTGGTTCTCQP